MLADAAAPAPGMPMGAQTTRILFPGNGALHYNPHDRTLIPPCQKGPMMESRCAILSGCLPGACARESDGSVKSLAGVWTLLAPRSPWRTLGSCVLPLFLLFRLAPAQDLVVSDLERLGSPFETERADAIASLVEDGVDPESLRPLLESDDPRLAVGSATVLARVASSPAAAESLLLAARRNRDRVARIRIGKLFFDTACRLRWTGEELHDKNLPLDSMLMRAACRFARSELIRLVKRGTEWTDYRALSSFFPMGTYAVPALAAAFFDEDLPVAPRALAAVALGRLDAREFWVGDGDRLHARLRGILDSDRTDLKHGLLFGAACFGHASRPFVRDIAEFTRVDASGLLIQSGLYYLYSLPQPNIEASRDELVACVEEFGSGYFQTALYNASELLARLKSPELARSLAEEIANEPTFASYWLFVAIMANFSSQQGAEAEARIRPLLEWALGPDQEIPQLEALGLWYWRERYGGDPAGSDVAAILEAVRESVGTTYLENDDPDNYAQRSGVEILALLGDPEAAGIIGRMLKHENEAVRMAAGMAAGNGSYEALVPALREAMREKQEYSSFGAAWGLKLLANRDCLTYFAGLLESGNAVLMPAALGCLRELTKQKLDPTIPKGSAAWRRRGRAWRAQLAKKPVK